ncbi:Homolog of Odr-2 (Two) [Caenorhabditis elegans]|uniref:Homolog of Odr-2 (Two) n=1 Tax=Caenorhabditis elegans TaxID=6239 RepID=G5EBH9_CAEEL|nr:Homolog of Odr-2 (Two) [Caenorhabditis elegans]CAB54445.2 Homolog of Odr-2 (Two) [Caenorhabditis elegans]DAA00038.1 TPA_exp: Ly-6-related protein HOT-7 [Caenorhabditis elegans]|eukprot:NP_496964.2 Homolog of Odr-2 (Two) [Caenorhabditis elegans]
MSFGILFGFLMIVGMVSASCFVCSSPNIENHYGSFFENPREIQPTYAGRVIDCEKNEFKSQDCPGPCFSLNVSSSVIDSDFGTSYGCSTGIIPDDVDGEEACTTKTISIRTSPIYSVTATYCLCSENNCNPPIHPVIRRRSKPVKNSGKTVYFANQSDRISNSVDNLRCFLSFLYLILIVVI